MAFDKSKVAKVASAIMKAMEGEEVGDILGLLAVIAATVCRKSGCEPDTFVELFSSAFESAAKK
jgi:hypothetical protein